MRMWMVIVALAAPVGHSAEAEAQDDPVEQGKRIAEKMWAEVQPALMLLQVKDVDSLKPKYIRQTNYMMKRFASLPKEKRDALAKAEKPVSGIDLLQINKGLTSRQKLYPPAIDGYVTTFRRPPLSPQRKAEILKKLQGAWYNEWKSIKSKKTWLIDAEGAVLAKESRRGKQSSSAYRLSFQTVMRVKVKSGRSGQTYVFLLAGDRFYLSSNLIYDAFRISNRDKFFIKSEYDYVLYDQGKCTVISSTGVVTKAESGWERKDGKDIFKLKFGYPGRVWRNGKPAVQDRTLHLRGDFLLHDSLVTTGKFLRKSR